MIKKCIKVPFNEEVTGKPGASIRFVEGQTIPLDTTVKAAIDGLYVIGQHQLVKNNFLGLMKSIADGVQRDGKPRKIADFLRVFPVFTGAVDLDKGYDPEVNGVYLAAALLNEMKLDISGWTFEDVTKGRQAIHIESIAGDEIGLIGSGSAAVNGTGLSAGCRVELQLEGGELIHVAPEHVSGSVSRIDIAAVAFDPLRSPENLGKKIKVTIRNEFAMDSMVVKFGEVELDPYFKSAASQKTGLKNSVHPFEDTVTVYGANFDKVDGGLEGGEVYFSLFKKSNDEELGTLGWSGGNYFRINDKGTIEIKLADNVSPEPDDAWFNPNNEVRIGIVYRGEKIWLPVKAVR